VDAKLLFSSKDEAYIYLERQVNDGSPSGWTDRKKTSEWTNPFTGLDYFPLLEFSDTDLTHVELGERIDIFERGVNYAHPDSGESPILAAAKREVRTSEFVVSPTAGGRTMFVRSPALDGYIKLTYDIGRLGRVDRQQTLKHCQSSLEVSAALKRAVDDGKMPETFSLLLETAAKVSFLWGRDGTYEWGTIFRERQPYPYRAGNVQLVPGFALFSKDRKHRKDERLINQLIRLSGSEPRAYLMGILRAIVDCYFGAVLSCAFYPECHAQNCLFEVDEQYRVRRLVMIDMDSVDKDLPLARQLGLRYQWDSYPQACYEESTNNYTTRASYIYDFKVGEYLLSRLIAAVGRKHRLPLAGLRAEIRDYARATYLARLPAAFFPLDGCWYDCENTERSPGSRRVYFPHKNPKFR
jgi:hypothetical protein